MKRHRKTTPTTVPSPCVHATRAKVNALPGAPSPLAAKRSRRFKLPNINKAWTECIWFENDRGERRSLTVEEIRTLTFPHAKRWPYALCRFPLDVTTKLYKRRRDGRYGTSDQIGAFSSSAPGDLAAKLVVDSQFHIKLSDALVIASTACERCMNILAWQHGLTWGYSPKSEQAKRCGTSCELCR